MSTRTRFRRRSGEDFDREIRAHLDHETDRLIEEGAPPDAARRAARWRFGSVAAVRERFYEAGRLLWWDHLVQDMRSAARNIRHYPIAAAVAIVSLGAGIGATTATLTIRDVIFRKPPPLYLHPEQLSRVQVERADRPLMPIGSEVPGPLFAAWRDTFEWPVAAATSQNGVREARTDDRTESVPVRAVTPNLFPLLGVGPILGRAFDDPTIAAADHPAILSYRVWQRLFDGRLDVIGRLVWIDNQPHAIVGVMPERFWFSDMSSPIWTRLDPRRLGPDAGVEMIVRRPPAVSQAMLEARLEGGLAEYAGRLPAAERPLRMRASGLEGSPVARQMALVLPYLLAVSVLLTLLIACANAAILMIAQWTTREHEIAIRASIGASRSRIVRGLVTESVLVAFCGGAVGVAAAFALRAWIISRGGDVSMFDLSINPRVLVEAAVVTLLSGMVAGVAPALSETRRLHTNPLRTMATSDRVRQRWRHALVVLEITVTVALLVETLAMVDGYRRTRNADLGFSPRPLITARIESSGGVPAARILDLLAQLPGVAVVAASTATPLSTAGPRDRIATDASGTNAVTAERGAITDDFFTALGVGMRAGRPFSADDGAGSGTAIVNEALARHLFANRDAVGGRVWIGHTSYAIVGVVADYASNPLRPLGFEPRIYLPLRAVGGARRLHVLVRAEGDPSPLVEAIRRAVREGVPAASVTNALTIDAILAVMGQEVLIVAAPLVPLIAIGMLLTMAGIYGVLAFAITRRAREFAVRVAVGASGWDLVRLVSAQAVRLLLTGSALGAALTFGLSRIVRASGGAGSVFDPAPHVFLLPVLIVVSIGALATVIPSRRALRIDPAELLRTT